MHVFYYLQTLSTALSRVVTPNQFSRILQFAGLQVSLVDCNRLTRKFADPDTGNVQYGAFCEIVDDWFKACKPVDPDAIEELIMVCIGKC
ncbi:unnamed protein product [Protopolystoma xenopodis]|uniref:EF-hand domain-containing protein n=1 Tax=Protopolystoma xenopodis TaxID=117903 RepID=A0A3S5A3X7_9PLAT|nr:unnamed protein product [Protopolystoma xenopodis]